MKNSGRTGSGRSRGRRSTSGSTNSKPAPTSNVAVLVVALFAALFSAAAVWFFYSNGSLLYFGDAESHLNIARRVLDSRTPGYRQLGTVWLPLPHILMIPFARSMELWRTGLAGSIPSACCFVITACFLFAGVRRVFDGFAAPFGAVALFVLNPNALYLQSTAMTEPIFFATFCGLFYATVAFADSHRPWFVVLAGLCAAAGTLTRFEGWFLLPFVAVFFFFAAEQHRLRAAAVFSVIAALGPVLWFAYNWWVFDNALEFYNGPGSPRAIQGGRPYPGLHDWRLAAQYYFTAAQLNLGAPLYWASWGCALAVLANLRRALWPFLFLLLPSCFYVISMHSSGGTPIFVPSLMKSWYNTRYGLVLLPFAAFACSSLLALLPQSIRGFGTALLILICAGQWLLFPRPESWVTWKESQVNSEARRAWTNEAVEYLSAHYKPGQTVFTTSGDVLGIFRRMGIPFRDLLTVDNGPLYNAVMVRPDLFLWPRWAVCMAGDDIQSAVDRARLRGPDYQLQQDIAVPGAPVVQIYLRSPKAPNLLP